MVHIKEDVKILIEHLEARGVVIDELLMQHLIKISQSITTSQEGL